MKYTHEENSYEKVIVIFIKRKSWHFNHSYKVLVWIANDWSYKVPSLIHLNYGWYDRYFSIKKNFSVVVHMLVSIFLLSCLMIWVFCFQVEFTAMRDQYMRCGEGFLICYSVTDRHSFQEALEYKKLIQKVRASEDTPLVLVGNKFDLHMQRKVTTEEGESSKKG